MSSAYSIVQIPGWETLSLHPRDHGTLERRLDDLAHGSVPAEVPRDTATPFRKEVRKELVRVVEQAQAAGAGLIALPVETVDGKAVPASYTVSEWRDPDPDDTAPLDLLKAIAEGSAASTKIVDVDGQPALREEMVESADPEAEPLATHAGRRVTYTVSAPDNQHSWVIFTFITLGDGNPDGPLAHLLVELFDAHLTTLRWKVRALLGFGVWGGATGEERPFLRRTLRLAGGGVDGLAGRGVAPSRAPCGRRRPRPRAAPPRRCCRGRP